MHKIFVLETTNPYTALASMLIGQMGMLHAKDSYSSIFEGEIILRTNAGFINLTSPERGADAYSNYDVELFHVGTRLELVVGAATLIPLSALTAAQKQEISALYDKGQRIEAIKLTRALSGSSLKDSKDFVESLAIPF